MVVFYMEVFEVLSPGQFEFLDAVTHQQTAPPQEVSMRHPRPAERMVSIWLIRGEFTEDQYLRYERMTGVKLFNLVRPQYSELCNFVVPVTWLSHAHYIPRDGGFAMEGLGYTSWEGVYQLTQRQYSCIYMANCNFHNEKYNDATEIMRRLLVGGESPPRFVERSARQIRGQYVEVP